MQDWLFSYQVLQYLYFFSFFSIPILVQKRRMCSSRWSSCNWQVASDKNQQIVHVLGKIETGDVHRTSFLKILPNPILDDSSMLISKWEYFFRVEIPAQWAGSLQHTASEDAQWPSVLILVLLSFCHKF